ncbi:ABC transporter permease subunit [Haloferula sp. BvORR071]|uniref:ABC transporter permease subunit n=1 Tax=Haloferula sp. BvORR071 TaxID=1396141 RepID=UPI00069898B3|nr:ABC transporter permease subunit [Haloferula sp. BvORR071]
MTFPRKIGLILILVAVAAAWSYESGLSLPSLRWFYSFHAEPGAYQPGDWHYTQERYIGHAFAGVIGLIGLLMIALGGSFHWNPLTLRRLTRFRSMGRGWLAFRIFAFLLLLAALDQTLVGRRALAVKYNGQWLFPAFQQRTYTEEFFGGKEDQEADYRALAKRLKDENKGDTAIMPPIPWDPVLDSDELQKRPLVERDGKVYYPGGKELFNGYALQYWPKAQNIKLRDARFRGGQLQGPATLFDGKGDFAGKQTWSEGKLVETSVEDSGPPAVEQTWVQLLYKPAPPVFAERHFLGTDSNGWDIVAQLFGGFQVIVKAAFFYFLLVYGAGITIGCLQGYLGGKFDLILERLVEIISNIPFLLVVMIITANIGRDNIDLMTIIVIFAAFSWIGISAYLRTATYKEKARDYAAAARVQGAGTLRVIFRHILPNAISTIVTLLPFTFSGLTISLTALDYLGFGLPDSYPSWGRVLEDGISNLSSPWIVASVFATLVSVLLLITFIGEAIREAFDPKKFTTYQ